MEPQSRTELATVLGDLAIQMQADVDSASLLRTIVAAAIDILPGISWGGIALVHRRTVTSEAPSDAIAKELDAFQSETGEGPAVTALRDHASVVVRDLEVEDRFPRFTERALELGVRSLMSFRLLVEGETFGALTLYGPSADLFTEESVAVGEIFAQHAAVAIAGAISFASTSSRDCTSGEYSCGAPSTTTPNTTGSSRPLNPERVPAGRR